LAFDINISNDLFRSEEFHLTFIVSEIFRSMLFLSCFENNSQGSW